MEKNDIVQNIEQLKKEFYSNQTKNMFFKSRQKLALASSISNSVSMEDLMQKTVFIIKETNKIYMDYTIFKAYANPSNYEMVVKYILQLMTHCVANFNSFEVHINLDTFSVSACHRYKEVIESYLNECLKYETPFTEKLIIMRIYNIPSVFDTIHKMLTPFIHEKVSKKIELHKKPESALILSRLLV